MRLREDFVFFLGISLLINSIIIYSLTEWLAPTIYELFAFLLMLSIGSFALAFIFHEFDNYIRKRILVRNPLEPQLLTLVILLPLYMLMVRSFLKYLAPYVFEKIGILEYYALSTIVPVLMLIIAVYVLSS